MFYKRFRQSQEIIKFINKIVQQKYDEVSELELQKSEIFKNKLYIDYQSNFKNVQTKLFKIQNVFGVSDKTEMREENGQVSRLTNYFHDNKNNLEMQFHIGLIGNSSAFGFDEDFATSQSIRILNNAFNLSFLERKAARSSKDAPQTEDILQTALSTLLKSFSLIVASEQSLMGKSISGYESQSIVKYILAFNKLYRQFKIHFTKCTFQNKMKKIFKGFKIVFLIHDYISVGNYIQASYSYLDFINQFKSILTLEQNFKAIEMAFYCLLFSKQLSFIKKIYGSESLGYFTDLLQKDEIVNLVQQNVPLRMNELQIYIDQGHEDFKNYEYYEEIEMKPLKMQKKESSYKEEEGMETYQISQETIYSKKDENKVEILVFENQDDETILLNQIMQHLNIFIKDILNPDEYVNSKRNIFTNIYNLLVAVIVNTDVQIITDQNLQKELVEKINKIFEEIMNGPFDSHFQNCYLLEQDCKLTAKQMKDTYNEFHQTDDHFKYTFFDFFKNKYNESSGTLCISIDLSTFGINQANIKTVKNNYDQLVLKRTKNMLQQNLLKQNLSKMIKKQNLKQKLQIEINKKNISDDVKNLLSHFGLIDLIQSNNLNEVEQIWGAIDNLSIRKHLLLEIISTKSAKTPLELDFIDQKVSEINEYIFKYVDWLRNNYISSNKIILGKQEISEEGSFAILDESCDQINEQSNEEMKQKLKEIDQLIVKFDASISIWHSQKMLEEMQNINSDIVISKEKRVMMKWSTLQKASRSISINILRANKDKLAAK